MIAQLEAEQRLLDAELMEAARLDGVLADLDTERQTVRLEHEKAKVEREDATGAVERLNIYGASQSLPEHGRGSASLVVARIMTQARCLVCDADAEEKRKELEALIESGCRPACGAEPEQQERIIPQHKFEQAKLDQPARRRSWRGRKKRRKPRDCARSPRATRRQSRKSANCDARSLIARLATSGCVRACRGILQASSSSRRL